MITSYLALKRHCSVVGLYLLLTLLMTLPLALSLNTLFPGTGGDPWQTLWRFEHTESQVRQAFSEASVLQFVRIEFFGGGDARLVNLSVWPWMWLQLLVGQPLTYNLVWLLSFILSGYAMYALVRYLTNEPPILSDTRPLFVREAPAFLAGLFYMFLPYHVAHSMGHFGAMQMQWLPALILMSLLWMQRATWPRTVGLILLVTIQAWTEHHSILWFVLFVVVAGFLQKRLMVFHGLQRPPLLKVFVVGLAFILLVLAPYAPTVRLAATSSSLSLGPEQTVRFSADPFAYLLPSPFHPVWGSVLSKTLYRSLTGNVTEATQFIGLSVFLLLLFFHQRVPLQQKRFWLVLGAFFFVISLGPRLHLLGVIVPLPLPWALIDSWPVFSAVRAVARAGSVVGVSVAVMFGLVLQSQLRRAQAAVLIAALVVIEFLFFPVPLQALDTSSVYGALADLPGTAVIEIPAATNYTAASQALYASVQHSKNVLGSIALERGAKDPELEKIKLVPGIRQLLYVRLTDMRENRREFFNQDVKETLPDALSWFDVSAIVLHPDSLSALQLATLRRFLETTFGFTPQEHGDILLYSPGSIVNPPQTDGLFLIRGAGWEGVSFDKEKNQTFAAVAGKATVTIVNISEIPRSFEILFRHYDPEEGGVKLTQGDRVLFETIPDAGTSYRVVASAPPGESTLEFTTSSGGRVVLLNPQFESTTTP